MRGRSFCLALVGLTVALAGCSSSEEKTPVACLGGDQTYVRALAAAPGEVRLEGSTPISGCLVSGQDAGELAQTGEGIVKAATQLNVAARANPGGPEAVQLGYLVGAVQQGASDTGGIHADLVRRLDAAARFSPDKLLPAEFERAFGRGYAAGQQSG